MSITEKLITKNKFAKCGQIFLWEYVENIKNYPGLHFTADIEACNFLRSIFEAWRLSSEDQVISLKLTNPHLDALKVPNNLGGHAKWKSKHRVVFRFLGNKSESMLDLDESSDDYILKFGSKGLEELILLLQNIQLGKGDYRIATSSKKECLWVWWKV